LNLELEMLNLRCAVVVLFLMACNDGAAQIQQAWVARYNNGITTGANQAVKMTLDSAGNIYVVGFSQNTNNQLGYGTIKYAPNGTQLWVARYDSTNYPTATPAGLALDGSNNVAVTGGALTVKYDSNGNQLWTAPYAGTTLAEDNQGNSYVGGFSQDFGTVKLSPQGSNIWLTTFVESYGPTVSESVLVDCANNVYVSGLDTYYYNPAQPETPGPYVTLTVIKYGANGDRLWKASQYPTPQNLNVLVAGAAFDSAENLYLVSNWPGNEAYFTIKCASNGTVLWQTLADYGTGPANGLAIDGTNVLLVGADAYQFNGSFSYYYTLLEVNSNGATVWTDHYLSFDAGFNMRRPEINPLKVSSGRMSETSVTPHKPEVSGSIPLAGTTSFSIGYALNACK